MSEKRFKLDIGDDYCFIDDIIENRTYAIYNDRFKERWAQEIVDLLNEEQSTISALTEENEQLKRKLKDCEHEHFLDGLGSSNKWFGMGGF